MVLVFCCKIEKIGGPLFGLIAATKDNLPALQFGHFKTSSAPNHK
jgi:hypothetical protein